MNKFLLNYVKKHGLAYVFSVLSSVISGLSSVAPYFLIYKILQKIIAGNNDFSAYTIYLVGIFVCYLMQNTFHKISTSISHVTTFNILGEMRDDLVNKLIRLPLGTVESYGSGNLKDRLMDKVDSMEATLAHIIPEVLGNMIVSIITLLFLFYVNWKLALVTLLIIPVALTIYFLGLGNYKEKFSNYIEKNKYLNNVIVEYIDGMEVIKTFHKSDSAFNKLTNAARDAAGSAINWMKDNLVPFSIAFTLVPSSILLVLPVGGYMYYTGSIAIEEFVLVLLLNFAIMFPLVTSVSHMDSIMQAMVTTTLLSMIMDREELVRTDNLNYELKNYDIEFKDVNFSYKEFSDKGEFEIMNKLKMNEKIAEDEKIKVLKDIDLTIKENSVTALVGPSGSGKSTITKLIASFYNVDSGSIKIGGVNINDIPLNKANNLISYVSQKDFLFDISIMDNLKLADENITDEEVIEIAKKCNVHDFIMSLSDGYNTIVGKGGGHLSGGEKQRLTIARAMIKNAPIIVFDEATAYTDPENEYKIQTALAALTKGKTVIVVAHRLSTIVDADKIYYIDKGEVKCEGTHDELMKNCSDYKRMYELHMSTKEDL